MGGVHFDRVACGHRDHRGVDCAFVAGRASRAGSGSATACLNNLKQIGLALHNYHSVHDVFAIGYVASPNADTNVTTPGWGWASAILPGLEQQPLYSGTNFNLPIEGPANSTTRTTSLTIFVCPTDRFTGLFTLTDVNSQPVADAQTNSYAGNFGRDVNIAKFPDTGNGMFMRNRAYGVRDMLDGTGQTILVGERGSLLTQVPWAGAINNGICRITPGSPSHSTRTKPLPWSPWLARIRAGAHRLTSFGTLTIFTAPTLPGSTSSWATVQPSSSRARSTRASTAVFAAGTSGRL